MFKKILKKNSDVQKKLFFRERRTPKKVENLIPQTTETHLQSKRFDDFISPYSEVIYDLCKTILVTDYLAATTFKKIWKTLQKKWENQEQFHRYSRPWALRIAYQEIRLSSKNMESKLTASEQIMLDSTLNTNARLEQFIAYFHRLTVEDQLLLSLKDKFGFPLNEVSIILGVPENTIKQQRQAIYRTLEDWIWKN